MAPRQKNFMTLHVHAWTHKRRGAEHASIITQAHRSLVALKQLRVSERDNQDEDTSEVTRENRDCTR